MARPKVTTNRKTRDLIPSTRRRVSPVVLRGWEAALEVSDQDLARFIPTKAAIDIGEALLAGQLTVEEIARCSGHTPLAVRQVLTNPTAMAWISRQIHNLFKHRAGVVDAALYQRAVAGDVNAIKLFYYRMGQLTNEQTVHHTYSGGVRLDHLGDEDLRRLIKDKNATLPAEFRVLDVTPEPGASIQGPGGTGAQDAVSPDPVLPSPPEEPCEAAEVPRGGEDPPP